MYTRRMESQPEKPPRVTERDRDYMRRLGEWKAESHREQLASHLAKSGRQRLIAGLRLMLEGPLFPRQQDDEGPSEFYDRARRLGLYRG